MPDEAPPPFPCTGYNIRDDRLAEHREVVIWAEAGPVPRLGDLFTIVRDAMVHDLMVLDVSRGGADWSVRCRVVGVA